MKYIVVATIVLTSCLSTFAQDSLQIADKIRLLVPTQLAVAQEKRIDLITLTIDKASLKYDSSKKSVLVPFTFRSNEDDVIVYGLPGYPEPVPFDLIELCDKKTTGTGVAFAIYRPDGRRENYQIETIHKRNQRPVTRERLDSIFRVSNERFIRTKRILLKNDTVSISREVSIKDFLLEPGLYYLQLAYFCGEKIQSALGPAEIKRSQGKLYQGCTLSKKIPFIVK